jgi:hypothetical protein
LGCTTTVLDDGIAGVTTTGAGAGATAIGGGWLFTVQAARETSASAATPTVRNVAFSIKILRE